MEARKKHPKPRRGSVVSAPPAHRLDAMAARRAGDVVGILRAETPRPEKGVPIGMWKTGWLAQPEGAA